jgi:hypothetical protein
MRLAQTLKSYFSIGFPRCPGDLDDDRGVPTGTIVTLPDPGVDLDSGALLGGSDTPTIELDLQRIPAVYRKDKTPRWS